MNEYYFDTNIYSHIHNRVGTTDKQVAKLHAAVRADEIRIVTSAVVVEETISALLSAEKEALARLKLIRKLAQRKRIIKFHQDLLEDDIKCFARGESFRSHFMAPPTRFIQVFVDHGADHIRILRQIAKKTQQQIQAFRNEMNEKYNQLLRPLAAQIIRQNQQQAFCDYWNELSLPFAEQLADKAGVLHECQARGANRLLDVRSVMLATLAQLSLSYANTYERGAVERGDSRDMQHAVLASAVKTFVTDDPRLGRVLTRMPLPDFEVIDLPTLLDRL
jgi:hypothetical protein